jgi:F-type H+-transporting ATPase subunit a
LSDKFYLNSPLDQFVIRDLVSVNMTILGDLGVALTNIGLYLTISLIIAVFLGEKSLNINKLVGSR